MVSKKVDQYGRGGKQEERREVKKAGAYWDEESLLADCYVCHDRFLRNATHTSLADSLRNVDVLCRMDLRRRKCPDSQSKGSSRLRVGRRKVWLSRFGEMR